MNLKKNLKQWSSSQSPHGLHVAHGLPQGMHGSHNSNCALFYLNGNLRIFFKIFYAIQYISHEIFRWENLIKF